MRKLFIILTVLYLFSSNKVYAYDEEKDIRNRINKLSIEVAKCNGFFRANGITTQSTGLYAQAYREGLKILSKINTGKLDAVENSTYKKIKQTLQKDTSEGYESVSLSGTNCMLRGMVRVGTLLTYFERINIIPPTLDSKF